MADPVDRAPGRGLIRQIGAVSLITGLGQVCFMAANLLLGRNLTQSDMGRVDVANRIINLTAYLSLFGLNSALIRSVPLADLQRYDWRAGIRRVALIAAAISLIVALGTGLYYHYTALETGAIGLASWTFSLTIAGSALLSIQRRFTLGQLLMYLRLPLALLVVAGLVVAGSLSTPAVLLTYAAAGLIQVIGMTAVLRSSRAGVDPLPTGRLVTEGLLFFGLFMTSTLMLRLDAFLLKGLLDWAAVGRYGIVANIALTGFGVLSLGVAQVLNPRIASREPLRLGRLLGLLLGVGLLAGVILTLVGTPLIHWLYGHRYNGDFTRLLALFSATGLVQIAYVVPSALLGVRASLRTLRLFLLINVVSVGINVALNLWLIPRYGLEGAALATLLSWVWRLGWAAELTRRLPATITRPGATAETAAAASA